jgi:Na+-transporting NADH:ubiquinone oxidoreductase subunit C
VDLKTGELMDKDPAKYNQALALKDPQMSTVLDASQDPAGIKRRSNVAEIYLVRDEQKRIQEIVLPIYGNGLWSMMYAFVALDTDGRTVKLITIRAKRRGWVAKWKTLTGVRSLSVKKCSMITVSLR